MSTVSKMYAADYADRLSVAVGVRLTVMLWSISYCSVYPKFEFEKEREGD